MGKGEGFSQGKAARPGRRIQDGGKVGLWIVMKKEIDAKVAGGRWGGEGVQRFGGCGPAGSHPQPLSQRVGAQASCSHLSASATKSSLA